MNTTQQAGKSHLEWIEENWNKLSCQYGIRLSILQFSSTGRCHGQQNRVSKGGENKALSVQCTTNMKNHGNRNTNNARNKWQHQPPYFWWPAEAVYVAIVAATTENENTTLKPAKLTTITTRAGVTTATTTKPIPTTSIKATTTAAATVTITMATIQIKYQKQLYSCNCHDQAQICRRSHKWESKIWRGWKLLNTRQMGKVRWTNQ